MRMRAWVCRVVVTAVVVLSACAGASRAEEKAFFPLTAWDDVRDADTIKKMA